MNPRPVGGYPWQAFLTVVFVAGTFVMVIAAWRYADQIQQALAEAWGWIA